MSIFFKRWIVGCTFALLLASLSILVAAGPATAPSGLGDVVSAEYAQYEWKNGDKPVRMLKRDEGFCFLTEIGGHFAGAGEVVRVYIGEDGYWYLAGESGQAELWGKAMSVKFAKKVKAAVIPAADPNAATWPAILAELSKNASADIQSAAGLEQKGLPEESDKLIALADVWEKSTRELPVEQRRAIETHVIWLYDRGMAGLDDAALAAARAKTEASRLAIANRQLNDFGCWKSVQGKWSVKDGVIEGRGDSRLTLMSPMPADCIIEWHMRVIDGMRPRVLFDGTDFYIGNEAFEHTIDGHGEKHKRSIPAVYDVGDSMKVVVKMSGKDAELYVDDNQIGVYERRLMPRTMTITLRGGDDWSPGATKFWGFKVSPVK